MIQKVVKRTWNISLPIIILLYTITNLFMLLNNGWFWDDWCLSSSEGIKSICIGAGIPFMIPIHCWLINLTSQPALLYHISTGVFEIFGIMIFYKCLTLLEVNRSNTFILTLFFAMLPYNLAKITMVCFIYTIGLLSFLFAVLLFIYFVRKNNLILRITSLILFFCSFLFLPSTLVLALVFFLFMAILSNNREVVLNISYFKTIFTRLLSWVDFMIIPFIFWVFRALFLKPTGIYAAEGYREFSFNNFLLTPLNLLLTFIHNFLGLGTVANPANLSQVNTLLFISLFVLLFILLRKYKINQLQNDKRFLFTGLFFFIGGALAYNLIGMSPSFDGYASRHQILLRFGSTFLLFYIVSLIQSIKAQTIIIASIISLFIVAIISRELLYQKSWFKQMALENEFVKEKSLREGVNFVVIDNTIEYNEYSRGYSIHCYTGILYKTFRTQTRFAIDKNELPSFVKSDPQSCINNALYHMKDCKNILSFDYSLSINAGRVLLSNMQSIKMLAQYYFDKRNFDNSLNEILSLHVVPYNPNN